MMHTDRNANCMMTSGASANRAEAPAFCARSAANTANTAVSLLMDAMVMASILIICALICLTAILALGISLLVLVLLAALLLAGLYHTPKRRRRA